jgi:transposase InsO family protein
VRQAENDRLVEVIRAIHRDSRQTYGSPSILEALRKEGWRCGKNRVARVMRLHGIRAKTHRRFRHTTNSSSITSCAPNLVQRNFTAQAPNRLWCSDITYIWTREGWLYLAMILDVFSRRIVGYALGVRLSAGLVTEALQRAMQTRDLGCGTVFHSDRGSQYASQDVRSLLARSGLRQSMSSTGSCYDNAMAESFFHSLKTELIYHEHYDTRQHASRSIFDYIEIFYNRHRRHSALGYLSPVDFEQLHS